MALVSKDLVAIKDLVKVTIEEDDTLARKEDISHLPSKNDFYEKMDEVMGELKAIREEQGVLSRLNEKVNDQDEKITEIQNKLQIQPA